MVRKKYEQTKIFYLDVVVKLFSTYVISECMLESFILMSRRQNKNNENEDVVVTRQRFI